MPVLWCAMTNFYPEKRITARQALAHRLFEGVRDGQDLLQDYARWVGQCAPQAGSSTNGVIKDQH